MAILLAAILGLIVGSFLNVLVFRTHEDISMKGRSKCMTCEKPINAKDLIPVLSYLILRGRCRKCKAVISLQYPLIELITAILFALSMTQVGDVFTNGLALAEFIRLTTFSTILIIIFVYDLRWGYILDRFTLPGMIIAILFNLGLGILEPSEMLIGALVIGGFFYLQFALSKGKWVGGGDIRMGVLMGLMLGLGSGLLALFIAYAIGALFGAGLILTGKKHLGDGIPFGTFLSVGAFIALLWGIQILQWYLGYF